MENGNCEFFKLQNEDGVQAIRCWINRRYKILQIIGCYNASVLTFLVSKQFILKAADPILSMSICFVSFLVALFGFSAEYSPTPEKFPWIRVPRLLKNEAGEIDFKGLFERGMRFESNKQLPPKLPVYRERRFFYFFLMAFGVVLTYFTINTLA
jgi:hypothetical protein